MENKILITDNIVIENNVEEQNIISLNKFIILCFITFWLYNLWWTYKAWRFFKQKEKSNIMPAARALFGIFFLNSLFTKILELAREKGYKENYSSVSLFICFFISNILAYLPNPFWLITTLSFVFTIPPFKALNYAKENSTKFTVNEQKSFSGRQIVLLVFGLIFWALILLGLSRQ